ncbi:MAG: PepSY domain-containing protein [Ilumatobacteraceae bacterium]
MKRTTRIITVSITAVALAVGAGTAFAIAEDDSAPVDGDAQQRATEAALAETGTGTVTDVEHDDGGYDVEVRLDDGTEVAVALATDFSVIRAETDRADDTDDADDATDDVALDATERQQAADAALTETGTGTVTDVERDDGGYDVEVRFDDGRETDVRLDADFSVRRVESDD